MHKLRQFFREVFTADQAELLQQVVRIPFFLDFCESQHLIHCMETLLGILRQAAFYYAVVKFQGGEYLTDSRIVIRIAECIPLQGFSYRCYVGIVRIGSLRHCNIRQHKIIMVVYEYVAGFDGSMHNAHAMQELNRISKEAE